MLTVADMVAAMERIAPRELALAGDPGGLQVGDPNAQVERAVVALDASPGCVRFAQEKASQLIISHHPILFRPLSALVEGGYPSASILLAARYGISLFSAHTNWDAAPGGINDTLADILDLKNVQDFGNSLDVNRYKLVTFLPAEHADPVLDALRAAGCGRIGLYDRCAFLSEGVGTYEPQEGANPFIGAVGKRETAPEVRIEMLVPASRKTAAIRALLDAHPYDEPAFDLYPLEPEKRGLGRVGDLTSPRSAQELAAWVEDRLLTCVRLYGRAESQIRRLAVVGGSGGDMWEEARRSGCDALLTGEVRHHHAVEASAAGFVLLEAGHYATEQPGVRRLAERLRQDLPAIEFLVYEPTPGADGRPHVSGSF
jgi:dinuclear metal center YbgI/SA1388 family protein